MELKDLETSRESRAWNTLPKTNSSPAFSPNFRPNNLQLEFSFSLNLLFKFQGDSKTLPLFFFEMLSLWCKLTIPQIFNRKNPHLQSTFLLQTLLCWHSSGYLLIRLQFPSFHTTRSESVEVNIWASFESWVAIRTERLDWIPWFCAAFWCCPSQNRRIFSQFSVPREFFPKQQKLRVATSLWHKPL